MLGQEKFNIVIGNPPYVGEKGNKETFRPIAESPLGKRFHQGKMDLFYFFFHIALDYLNEGGVMAYITTNYYITATGAVKLRKDMHDRSSILKLLNFGELKIFESALGQHNMITMLIKGKKDIMANTLVTHKKGYLGVDVINSIINGADPDTDYYQMSQDDLYSDGNIKLTNGGLDEVLDIIKKKSIIISDIADVNEGIQTGANEVFLFESYPEFYDNLNTEEKALFRPFYKNSDIKKYQVLQNKVKYILYINNNVSLEKNIPEIKKYLESKKDRLMNRAQIKRSKQKWYTLLWPRNESMFEKEAIVTSYRPDKTSFGYKDFSFYSGTDTYYVTNPKESYTLKYILGILNSFIADTWFHNRGKVKGEILEMTGDNIEKFPIPKITKENRKIVEQIEKLVDQILLTKKENQSADTKNLEQEIDQLVYGLYELTPDEIEIIENSSKK
ncbi:MAG: Eco57I restriction-modification methylase domain-containing protein [Candidatus Nomurabacteria bacterium]|nr:Eco57I restriction-modification methylase domain-containing protein [Candidatus Nomurabacteria bacterium]